MSIALIVNVVPSPFPVSTHKTNNTPSFVLPPLHFDHEQDVNLHLTSIRWRPVRIRPGHQ